jgi:hypothetical protein
VTGDDELSPVGEFLGAGINLDFLTPAAERLVVSFLVRQDLPGVWQWAAQVAANQFRPTEDTALLAQQYGLRPPPPLVRGRQWPPPEEAADDEFIDEARSSRLAKVPGDVGADVATAALNLIADVADEPGLFLHSLDQQWSSDPTRESGLLFGDFLDAYTAAVSR